METFTVRPHGTRGPMSKKLNAKDALARAYDLAFAKGRRYVILDADGDRVHQAFPDEPAVGLNALASIHCYEFGPRKCLSCAARLLLDPGHCHACDKDVPGSTIVEHMCEDCQAAVAEAVRQESELPSRTRL